MITEKHLDALIEAQHFLIGYHSCEPQEYRRKILGRIICNAQDAIDVIRKEVK